MASKQEELCDEVDKASSTSADKVKNLLDAKADPNLRELKRYGLMSPFIAACKNCTPEVVEVFLSHPDIQLEGVGGRSPLLGAIEYKNTPVIDLLLRDQRIDPSETDMLRAFQARDMDLLKKLAQKAPIPSFEEGQVDEEFMKRVCEEIGINKAKSARK